MNGRRSLLGLTFCTCYLASHLTNKVSARAAATARGLPAVSATSQKLAGAGEQTDPESTSPELRFGPRGLFSRGGCGSACTKPGAPSPALTLSAPGRWRQEFEASLGYLKPCLKKINTYIRKQRKSGRSQHILPHSQRPSAPGTKVPQAEEKINLSALTPLIDSLSLISI